MTNSQSPIRRFLVSRLDRIAIAIVAILATGGIVYSAARAIAAEAKATAPATPQPGAGGPTVTVAPVEQRLVTEYEELTGRIEAAETVELQARVSGHLEVVRFQAGQTVKPGDILFTIDSRWYQAQFDLARATFDAADREAKRAESLLASGVMSTEEADGRLARAAEARATLTSAQLDLENTEVRSPIAGRIGRALVTAGNLVSGAPGTATVLATIVSNGDAFVYADLDEATVLKFSRLVREKRLVLEDGRVPVELQLADETGYPRRGYIESTDNRLNPSTGTLTLRMVFPNPDEALLPGLFARVRVPVSAPESALLVSEAAIGTDQSQKFVLALGDGNTVVYRTVRLGGAVDGKRVVRDGLQPGEKIVVNGLQRVRPGMTVTPEAEARPESLASR